MLFPKCPRCSNRLSITAFLIRPKEDRLRIKKKGLKIEDITKEVKVKCNKCTSVVRINPKVTRFIVITWIVFLVIILIGTFTGKLMPVPASFLDMAIKLLVVVFAGYISMLLCWYFLEVVDEGERN